MPRDDLILAPNTSVNAPQFAVASHIDPLVTVGVVSRRFPVGMTIREVLDDLDLITAEVLVGGEPVPVWAHGLVRPKEGVVVELRPVPGVTGLIAIVSALAGSVASSIAAGIFGTTLTGTIISGIIGAAVSFLVQWGLSSLFGIGQVPEQENTPTRYSISARRNNLTPFAPFPVLYGRHRVYPDHGASPYTEIVGDDQYLRQLFVWSIGEVSLEDIRIGETSLDSFEDYEIEHSLDGSKQVLELYPSTVDQQDFSIELDTDPVVRETSIECTEIGLTITFPQGLYEIDNNGNRVSRSATIVIDYRPKGETTWTSWVNESISRSENAAVRISYRVTGLQEGKYEVQVRRGDTPSDSSRVADDSYWTALRSFRSEPPISIMDKLAVTALRVRATDQLNGVIDQFNAIASRVLPTWDGVSWSGYGETRNPAAAFRDVLLGEANSRPVDPSNVDDEALGEWYEFCEAKGLTYDRIINSDVPVHDLLKEIAAAGMASPTVVGSKYSVIIDREQTTPVQYFTPRNARNFSSDIIYGEQPHALRIAFNNEDEDWEPDERIVYDDGYNETNASRFVSVQLPGVTDPDDVYVLGRTMLAVNRLRAEIWRFEVDFEHLVAVRGDLVGIQSAISLIGQVAGRIKSISGTLIELDEFVVFDPVGSYSLRIRTGDGQTEALVVNPESWGTPTTNRVISETAPVLASAGDLFMFGAAGEEVDLALVQRISPLDNFSAEVECVPYRPEIYSAADAIPPYQPVISSPASFTDRGPTSPRVVSIISDEGALPKTLDGVTQPAILMTVSDSGIGSPNRFVTPASRFIVRHRQKGSQRFTEATYDASGGSPELVGTSFSGGYRYVEAPADTSDIRIDGVEAGATYELGVRAVDANGGASRWTTAEHTVVGLSAPPPPVSSFRISAFDRGNVYLEWEPGDLPGDVIGYEIRYSPDPAVQVWSQMARLVELVPRRQTTATAPHLSGAYAIACVDASGNRSTALFVSSELEYTTEHDVVLVSDASENDWGGTYDNAELSPDPHGVQLASDVSLSEWSALSDVSDLIGAFVIGEGYYVWGNIDLGAVFTSNLRVSSLSVDVVELGNNISEWAALADVNPIGDPYLTQKAWAAVEVSTSSSETPTWGSWQPLVAGDYSFRHVRFRIRLVSTSPEVAPVVTGASIAVDVPERIEQGSDVLSSSTGPTAIAFVYPFIETPSITIAGQDMQSGDYYEITGRSASGFSIAFKDASGAYVQRLFDWQAIGYGRQQ